MRKWRAFCFFFLASLCLFTSCVTKTETITEYVPVSLDINSLIKPILDMRPEEAHLVEDVQTLADVMSNSVAFQTAYQNWRDYALTLEGFYLSLPAE